VRRSRTERESQGNHLTKNSKAMERFLVGSRLRSEVARKEIGLDAGDGRLPCWISGRIHSSRSARYSARQTAGATRQTHCHMNNNDTRRARGKIEEQDSRGAASIL